MTINLMQAEYCLKDQKLPYKAPNWTLQGLPYGDFKIWLTKKQATDTLPPGSA
jgi:hypothetical protein